MRCNCHGLSFKVNVELRSYLEKVGQTLASREYDAEFRLVNRYVGKGRLLTIFHF